jgi:selenocysteine lyase/cysteine desulfurase
VSQSVGALPLNVRESGADFLVSAGYKWLLSPYGTGFFWIRKELISQMRPAPYYWMALAGADHFDALSPNQWKPVDAARRWDTAETASFFNLAPMEASLSFLVRTGVQTVWDHNASLIAQIIERLPKDRCVLASPADLERRGPYVCVAGRSPEKTRAMYEMLREARIYVSLREGTLRIAPHVYNSDRDVDRLIHVLSQS